MPLFGLIVHESYRARTAPQPDRYGRRIRQVEGVHVVGERESPLMLSGFYMKTMLALTLVAAVAASLAAWRLFTFPH
jgi:hypothetical protein